jgi:predicted RNA-binding Zn ribbon-like protein
MQDIRDSTKIRRRRPPRFELIAGALCLDFINTLDDRFSPQPNELLAHYGDLARFGEDTGIVSDFEVDRLVQLSMERPEVAQKALKAAIQMREAMYEVFWALVRTEPVPQAALLILNGYVQSAAQHLKLVPVNGHLDWRFDRPPNDLEAPLWPIARSAAELLASERAQYVRACDSETCLWLFLDTSRNHRRRWCDMTKCGNRAKARAFYDRKKKA